MSEKLLNLEKTLADHEQRIAILEKQIMGGQRPGKKATSLREFIIEKKPKNDVQRTLVIGYFLENSKGLQSFNTRDLEKGFAEAREKTPGNVADKVLKNISNGHLMEAEAEKDNLKAYVLTNSGSTLVDSGFE